MLILLTDIIGGITFSKRFGFMDIGADDGPFAQIEGAPPFRYLDRSSTLALLAPRLHHDSYWQSSRNNRPPWEPPQFCHV